ncbi:MAG: response regulator [Chitinophagaceae bacterium]|nr:MAG: response regulator [Chitinophagaceae bacterium]
MSPENCVLYADDDADDREMMSDMFAEIPRFHLKTFDSGLALLGYLERTDPAQLCFIILDNNMPLMTGYEVLEAIRKMPAFSRTPAVIYTTGTQPDFEPKVKALGAALVIKPTSLDAIRNAVHHIVDVCTTQPG